MPHQRRWHTEPLDAVQDRREQVARHRHLGHLEDHVLRVRHHLGSDLDQLFSQCGERPVLHRLRQRGRGVWQPRYWEHRIRDEDDWFRLRDYIHLNPVKHGYVVRPEDWPWSSLHRHIRLGWVDGSWPGSTPIEMPDMPGE